MGRRAQRGQFAVPTSRQHDDEICTETVSLDVGKPLTMCLHSPHSDLVSDLFRRTGRYRVLDAFKHACALEQVACAEGEIFVDCGAGIGYLSLYAAALGMIVHAVEPIEWNAELILASLERNNPVFGPLDVSVYQAGIGQENSTATMSLTVGNMASTVQAESFQVPMSGIEFAVHLTTIPSLVSASEIELVSLNCQGCEMEALQGIFEAGVVVRHFFLMVYPETIKGTAMYDSIFGALRILHDAGFCFSDWYDDSDTPHPIVDILEWQTARSVLPHNRINPSMGSIVLASRPELCHSALSSQSEGPGGDVPTADSDACLAEGKIEASRLHVMVGGGCAATDIAIGLRKLIVLTGLIRELSAQYSLVYVDVCAENVGDLERLCADLHNVHPMVLPRSSATAPASAVIGASVLDLSAAQIRRLGQYGVAEDEAMYLAAGVPFASSWSSFRYHRNATAEEAVCAAVLRSAGEPYALWQECASPAECARARLPSSMHRVDLLQVLRTGHSLLDLGLLLERAAELHLVDGAAAVLADRLHLSRVSAATLLLQPADSGHHLQRVFRRPEWEWAWSPEALGHFEFAFAAAETALVPLSPKGYGTIEFQLSSAVLCAEGVSSRLGVRLLVDGEEVQRVEFGPDEECEEARSGMDPGWEGDATIFLGDSDLVRRVAATFDGTLSGARYLSVRHEVQVRVRADAEGRLREEAKRIRVLLLVAEDPPLEAAGRLEQGLRRQIRSLRGASQVHVCLSSATSLEVLGALTGMFREAPEQIPVSVVLPDAAVTHDTHPQSWKGVFAVMEYGQDYRDEILLEMVTSLDVVNRAAIVGIAGYTVDWKSLRRGSGGNGNLQSLLRMVRSTGGDRVEVADVLELGLVVFHSSVDRAEFAQSVYQLSKHPRHLWHLYLAHAAHQRGIPRVVVAQRGQTAGIAMQEEAVDEALTVVLDLLPRTTRTLGQVEGADESWTSDSVRWKDWLQLAVQGLALAAMHLNHPTLASAVCAVNPPPPGRASARDTQRSRLAQTRTIVFNLAHHVKKRRHMEEMIAALGLTNVSFTNSTQWNQVDLPALIEHGLVSSSILDRLKAYQDMPRQRHLSYVAQGVDQVRVLREAAAEARATLILEDDLMLAASPARVRDAIDSALEVLPATADVVYLEACYETCEALRYSRLHPGLARASAPSCSAAMLWTVRGVQKAAALCTPVFDAVDRMYQLLISTGQLEAYILTPPLIYQDQFWGSNREPAVGLLGIHAPLRPVCGGPEAAKLWQQTDLHQVGLAVPWHEAAMLAASLHDASHRKGPQAPRHTTPDHAVARHASQQLEDVWYVFVARSLSEERVTASMGSAQVGRVTYSTARAAAEEAMHVSVGTEMWRNGTSNAGSTLVLEPESACFEAARHGVCLVEMRWSTVGGTVLATQQRSLVTVDLQQFCHPHPPRAPATAPPAEQVAPLSSGGECTLERATLLRDVEVVFDGYFYKLLGGKMTGINKMWFNIVPFMADAVQQMGGSFTHCQSAWTADGVEHRTDIPGIESVVDCENLTAAVRALPARKHKIVFSSYYRLVEHLRADDSVCNIMPIYDFIPERMGVAEQQHWTFHAKSANIPFANGFLSLSNSTTEDLQELHAVDKRFISTSPNRVSPMFKRVPPWFESDLSDLLDDHEKLDSILNSQRRFLLLVGHSRFAGEYKGYGIFWTALSQMPSSFAEQFSVLIFGGPPENDPGGFEVLALDQMPEEVLPIFYSKAAAMVYPSQYEGFGMPPIEAIACGCPVILGSFYEDKMRYVYGDDALYARDVDGMKRALLSVERGEVPSPERLIARASAYGEDTRRGWNEVARDYLEFMLRGPFREVDGTRCPILLPPECADCIQLHTTDDGVRVDQRCGRDLHAEHSGLL